MLAGLTGVAFIALGLWIIYYYVSRKTVDDGKAFMLLTFSSLLIVSGIFLITSSITLKDIARKFYGILLLGIGGYLSIGFPDMAEYHPEQFDVVPMFVGMILISIGIYLILF